MNNLVRMAIDRGPDVDLAVSDRNFCLVNLQRSMFVRFGSEQVSHRISLEDRLMRVAELRIVLTGGET